MQHNSVPPPPSLQSALQMDPNQQMQMQQHQQAQQAQVQQQQQQQQQQQEQQQQSGSSSATKRRRRTDAGEEESPSSSEPRRLRRSHEACARCRSKKIKCDSKHPRCTACATAGTACNQEDRHRRTLTPRGHTERLELQLAQCEALLKRHLPNFTLDALDEICAREGIDVPGLPLPPPTSFPMDGIRPFRPDGPPTPNQSQKQPTYTPMYGPPGPHPMMHPPFGPHPMMPYPPQGPPYHPHMMPPPPGAYPPHLHPAFPAGPPYPHPPPMHPPPPPVPGQPQQPPAPSQPAEGPAQAPAQAAAAQQAQAVPQAQAQRPPAVKGVDPHGHDMSSAGALAKNFGVAEIITESLELDAGHDELPVDPNNLPKLQVHDPRDPTQWISITLRRNLGTDTLSLYGPISKSPTIDIWLPKDRKFAVQLVDVYFTRLNIHRPVYARKEFLKILSDLYDAKTGVHDPGHICSMYLIFALGTLSELNHRAANQLSDKDIHLGSSVAKKLMPVGWPAHDEFFERALAAKPDLRVSITSLQALILLHWYLYTERHGRTLWRLVGTLVRLAIELGLHHEPTPQLDQHGNPVFTDEECQLRIRLWAIVLVHDRGTAILLGRPLAISPSDSNTQQPNRSKNVKFAEFSEHFEHSNPVAEIQADIVNALYAPTLQRGDTMMRNATRIIKRMCHFRDKGLPEKYRNYFTGTKEWPLRKKEQLVENITENEGLTLLKIGIARILMLRALFSSKDLTYEQKHQALVDAIITSHNVIVVHSKLIRFPDIAFFTSPIPLHIASLVILYGHISKVNCLPLHIALEDIFTALDMLPRFRWRWERKDAGGSHPLIAKLGEHIFQVSLSTVTLSSGSILIDEQDWDEVNSPAVKSILHTPVIPSSHGAYPGSAGDTGSPYHGGGGARLIMSGIHQQSNDAHSGQRNGGAGGSAGPEQFADMPQGLLYPFYPEAEPQMNSALAPGAVSAVMGGGPGGAQVGAGAGGSVQSPQQQQNIHAYDPLLKEVAALQGGYGAYATEGHNGPADPRQQQQQQQQAPQQPQQPAQTQIWNHNGR